MPKHEQRTPFDSRFLNEVLNGFMEGKYEADKEKADLTKDIKEAFADSKVALTMTAEICLRFMANQQDLFSTVGGSFVAGIVAGIYMQRRLETKVN